MIIIKTEFIVNIPADAINNIKASCLFTCKKQTEIMLKKILEVESINAHLTSELNSKNKNLSEKILIRKNVIPAHPDINAKQGKKYNKIFFIKASRFCNHILLKSEF